MRSSSSRPVSIARQLQGSFRLISVIVAIALVIAGLTLVLSVFVVGPQLGRAIDINNDDHQAQQAMLNEETGLRGYLLTGATNFLQPYEEGVTALAQANTNVDREVAGSSNLESYLLPARVAQQIWVLNWAGPAAAGPLPANVTAALAFIGKGKVLFDAYRAREAAFSTQINAELSAARSMQYLVLGVAAGLEMLLFAVTLVVTARQHHRLQRDIVHPVDALLASMRSVRDGEVAADVPTYGPLELRQIGVGLVEMTQSLADERVTRLARESDAVHNAQRLQQILTLAREVAGSLNLRYVLRSVGTSALVVSSWSQAIVWLTDDDQNRLVPAYDSSGPDGAPMGIEPLLLGEGCAGKAAKYGRTATEGGENATIAGDGSMSRLALPMVVGARVVGVLEVRDLEGRAAEAPTVESLDALATHAGTAIEAARLHQKVEERSEQDALTRLLNRHRFETDLAAECGRSLRYHRPLAFVMMDVDHFKDFNDEHGHQRGDEVLQEVAAVLSGELREGDTAYRYGGEEFAVLLRETDAGDAAAVAERIRARIAESFASHGNHRPVTASFGVAEVTETRATPDQLVRAADAALYQAKREGRDRVVVSSEGTSLRTPLDGATPGTLVRQRGGRDRRRTNRDREVTPPVASAG